MKNKKADQLSRRERQIMDVLYRKGSATAMEVQDELPESPSYSAVRALLRILEEKGYVKHKKDGLKYIFSPTTPKSSAVKTAMRSLLNTFFNNSTESAISALLEMEKNKLSEDDYKRISELIEKARKEE